MEDQSPLGPCQNRSPGCLERWLPTGVCPLHVFQNFMERDAEPRCTRSHLECNISNIRSAVPYRVGEGGDVQA